MNHEGVDHLGYMVEVGIVLDILWYPLAASDADRTSRDGYRPLADA